MTDAADGLISKIKSYDPQADVALIQKAFDFGEQAHSHQVRASGEPYFSHPVAVAHILCDMHMDVATLITALLHDTVEDTGVTLEDIRKNFGADVSKLVDGVTKLSRLEGQPASSKETQAENFRKLVLAMSKDIRVLLVKLSDRLHNMRTLHHVGSPDKQRRIARETLEIYAPLAERIGMMHFKDELEDLAFSILNPDARESILGRLAYLETKDGSEITKTIIDGLTDLLEKEGVKAEISGRVKRPYSIWRKMRMKNVTVEQLSDIMAFRILVDSTPDCYRVLGILHSTFSVVPGRFKDYISTPKQNLYQSLHTGLIGPGNHRIEVQIRTQDMHQIAELGVAAHWQYKEGKTASAHDVKEKLQYRWLRSLLDILENTQAPEEFMEHTKLEMFQDQVFCFTPAGDLITLPQGATPIDFAYAIHSEVGNRCVSAKINARMVPLRTLLQNGDQVEITTSKSQNPSPAWERFVVTGKARANIRRFIRTQKRDQYMSLGKTIVLKIFEQERLTITEKLLEKALGSFKIDHVEDLYALVGEGLVPAQDLIKQVYPRFISQKNTHPTPVPDAVWTDRSGAISIRGLIPGMAVHYARCCHPLPGDRIVGIIMSGRGVTIHTYDCEMLKNFSNEPDRWLDVTWAAAHEKEKHVGRLHVSLSNEQGALASLTTTISKNQGNIVNLKVTNRTEEFFDLNIDVEVKDADHMLEIIASLRSSPFVHSVERAR
jgi:guanosine-3',5'-bis(diphosphate) 3'-pyrophosphohydrolase